MLSCTMEPRFCETDALGHINNTVVPMWFETARGPVFEVFNPGQDLSKWNVILRKNRCRFYRADLPRAFSRNQNPCWARWDFFVCL